MEFHDLKAYGEAIKRIEVYNKVGITDIPFSCTDALVAILSDFILALQEVDVAVVFSYREDGIKFSVRSEDPDVHAGYLIHQALQGYGDGGGHAEMAAGMIRKENMHLLGKYSRDVIRELFLKEIRILCSGKCDPGLDPAWTIYIRYRFKTVLSKKHPHRNSKVFHQSSVSNRKSENPATPPACFVENANSPALHPQK